ncbi:MAG TPA: hypothetical protein VK169_02325 [Saprospiraceae bacterium]|nr:hypothetical protein [Saprospiraceae bacterium]
MKSTILLLLLILTNPFESIGQFQNGTYFDNSDFIRFENNTIDFKLKSNGGITFDITAKGSFKLLDNFIIVHAKEYNGMKSFYTKIPSQKEITKVYVYSNDNLPVKGVNVVLKDADGKFLSGTITNEDGIANIEKNDLAHILSLSLIGFDNYSFAFTTNFDYQVNLMNYEVLENQQIIFKINEWNIDSINLTLLSTDFKQNSPKKKDLFKLNKQAKALSFSKRLFIRE